MRAIVALAFIISIASPCYADDALLAGFSAGGVLAGGRGRELEGLFRVAVGVDWLDEGGFVARSRFEATHVRDLAFAIGLGYYASGLRTNEGSPFGATIGGAVAFDRDDRVLAGPRVELVFGLWYARALLELDFAALYPIDRIRAEEPSDLAMSLGLSLRLVPWSPFLL